MGANGGRKAINKTKVAKKKKKKKKTEKKKAVKISFYCLIFSFALCKDLIYFWCKADRKKKKHILLEIWTLDNPTF
jgi:hypothetical protein